jgi:hypothetical protein
MERDKGAGSAGSAEGDERRRYDRRDRSERGTLTYLGISYPTTLLNVSAGGALVASSVAPPVSAEVEVDFPDLGRVLGNVVHSRAGGIGIEFKMALAGEA